MTRRAQTRMDPLSPTGRFLVIAVLVALLALVVLIVSAQRSELPRIEPSPTAPAQPDDPASPGGSDAGALALRWALPAPHDAWAGVLHAEG